MTGMASSPPCVWRISVLIGLLVFVSSCAFGDSSPVNSEGICENGQWQDGICECEPCWTGDNCDKRVHPRFQKKERTLSLGSVTEDEVIFRADAFNPDHQCNFDFIQYSLSDRDGQNGFVIHEKTGEVRMRDSSVPIPEGGHTLTIQAYSRLSGGKDNMTLVLLPATPHHVHKRAVITLPDNVTFTLTKTGSSESVTDMRVGTKVSFELKILFPQTTTDMLVELFAPDNESMVMMLCDVQIQSTGANLQYTGDAQIVLDSQNQSTRYFDRAIIDFGNVTNTFTDQSDEVHSSIIIQWDAVMIDNDLTQHDKLYWVSAGAEYNYEMEVWVGQASFTAKTTDTDPFTPDPPRLDLSGPSTLMIGSSAVFKLDMYIDHPSVSLSVDAFAPLNSSNVMSICGMRVVETAGNYKCGFIPQEHEAVLHQDDNSRGYDRARLELATVTNKGSRESGNTEGDNRITVEFLVHLYDDISYVDKSFNVGAAAEIGTSTIWAGIVGVTATAYTPTPSVTPTWQISTEGSGKVSTVAPLTMTVDITIPTSTSAKYAIEVLAPFEDSAAVFQLCAMRIISFGSNLACTDATITPSYTSRGDLTYTDRIYMDMGTLTNVGHWGWQPYNLVDVNATHPDLLRVEFTVKATNHALATAGSQHSVTLGLNVDDSRLLVGTQNVEVEAAASVPNITEEMTPDWELQWAGGSENVRIGGAGQFLFTVTTKRDVVYSPFDIEALMPNSTSGSVQMSLCKVQVHSVGANLPCVVAAAVNRSVTYTSSNESAFAPDQILYERGVVNLPSLCNKGVVNDTAEDKMTLKVGFRVHSDAGLTNLDELWPSVGVMFSPYKMWVGQIKAVVRDDLPNTGTQPHVDVVPGFGDVPVGYFASYTVVIKTTPGSLATYTINVTVSTAVLSVCSVRVLEVGDNMPCTNGSTLEAVYEPDANGGNVKGSIDFGSVSNVGSGSVTTDTTMDDNTILVEVLIGISSDTAVVADGSTHMFAIDVYHDGSFYSPNVPPFTAIHDQSSLSSTTTDVNKVELTVAPITETDNSTDVVLGQSKRLEMCVWTYPGAITKLVFKMMTPIDMYGAMELTHIRNSFGGKNLPCVGSCFAGTTTYAVRADSSYTDIGTLDLGYVLNNNLDPIDDDANKLCVDGVFRVLRNDTLTPNTVLQPAASLTVNDIEINVIQLSLTVVDNSTFTDIYLTNSSLINNTIISVNASVPSPLCLAPSDVQTLPMVVTIPPYITSVVNMDLKMDLNESACMTFLDWRLISVGRNLKGFGKEYDLFCMPNSTMGTTQNDTAECNFGIVTNPAMSHRCDDVATDDDAIYLELDFQMADCPLAEHDAELTVSMGLKVAGYIAILNQPVKVCRDGTEAPVYNITALANSTGDVMYMEFGVHLDNTSKAEVHNASLVIMPPEYITCSTLHSSSGTNMAPVVDSTSRRMIITLGSIYFTDVINLLVRCDASSSYTVPSGISGHFTVVKYQLSGDVIPRAGSTLPSFTVWSDMDFVNFTATTVSSSGVSCTSSALGLQDSSVIYDCQISASAASLTDAINGRKGSTGWTPYVREGELMGQRYFQVYFANKVLVDRIEIAQLATARAIEIKLAYSNDGQAFMDGDTIALGGLDLETVQVPSPQDCQVLRVYVTNNDDVDQQVKLTFEFFGCERTSGGPTGSTAVCAAANAAVPLNTPDLLFHRRSFLGLADGSVFVCDGVVENKVIVQRCFVSDGVKTWQRLDSNVASMVGHDPDTDRVFALSQDGVTFMSSGDQGLTWATTHPDVLTKAQGNTLFVAAKDVPWTDSVQLPRGSMLASYQSGSWGADFDYLKKNEGSWNNKLKWDCC